MQLLPSPISNRRRGRPWRAALAVLVGTLGAPLAIAGPVGADPAPLVTEDGVGIRVDETAIQGPALEAIENATQGFVDDMIYDGGIDGAPLSSYTGLTVSSNLELSIDFLAPSGSRPDGGIAVHADIQDIELEYRADPWWPWDDCSIWIRPDDATIDVTASIDRSKLPSAPITIDPVQATWDDDPTVDYSGVCWYYLIDDLFAGWWDDFVGNDPESTASRIEAEIDAIAQGLLDDLWTDNVTPVLDSLTSFGISVNQLRTDDHGLIVTADVDATDLTIPGIGGPFDVSGAEDSGADSGVNTLLANRTTADGPAEVIVSVHPNVANQFLHALNTSLGGHMANALLPASIEEVLLLPEHRSLYPDELWLGRLQVQAAPYTQPTGSGGAPELRLPQLTLDIYNLGFDPSTPVASFAGSMSGIDLVTEVRPGTTEWGPGFDSSSAVLSVTRTAANSHASLVASPSSAAMQPYAVAAFDQYDSTVFVQYVSLAPIDLYGLSVDLCTSCGRFSGDERYTEVFKVT